MLQRGAYATMVVRYLFNEAIATEPDEDLVDEGIPEVAAVPEPGAETNHETH